MNIEMQEQVVQAPKDTLTELSSFADPFYQQVIFADPFNQLKSDIFDYDLKSHTQSYADGCSAVQNHTQKNSTISDL